MQPGYYVQIICRYGEVELHLDEEPTTSQYFRK
jgi:hypothetical protein